MSRLLKVYVAEPKSKVHQTIPDNLKMKLNQSIAMSE